MSELPPQVPETQTPSPLEAIQSPRVGGVRERLGSLSLELSDTIHGSAKIRAEQLNEVQDKVGTAIIDPTKAIVGKKIEHISDLAYGIPQIAVERIDQVNDKLLKIGTLKEKAKFKTGEFITEKKDEASTAMRGLRRFMLFTKLAWHEETLSTQMAHDKVIKSAPEGAQMERTFGSDPDPEDTVPTTMIQRINSVHRQNQARKIRELEVRIDDTVHNNETPTEQDTTSASPRSLDPKTQRWEAKVAKQAKKDAPKTHDLGSQTQKDRLFGPNRKKTLFRLRGDELKDASRYTKLEGVVSRKQNRLDRAKTGDTFFGHIRARKIAKTEDRLARLRGKVGSEDRGLRTPEKPIEEKDPVVVVRPTKHFEPGPAPKVTKGSRYVIAPRIKAKSLERSHPEYMLDSARSKKPPEGEKVLWTNTADDRRAALEGDRVYGETETQRQINKIMAKKRFQYLSLLEKGYDADKAREIAGI